MNSYTKSYNFGYLSTNYQLKGNDTPVLDLMPRLQAQGTRDCNKGIKFKKGAKFCLKTKLLPQY